MATKSTVHFLPETDSEDDWCEAFMFGDNYNIERKCPIKRFDEELYDALKSGDLKKVREEMGKLKFNVDDTVSGFYPPLHVACEYSYYDIVKYLLVECNADINKCVDSQTPLLRACRSISNDVKSIEDTIELLLKHHAVINVSDKYGFTPFMLACQKGYENAVKLMIHKANFCAKDTNGETALFHAIAYNRYNIVQLLVEAGVNCEEPNGRGYTPTQFVKYHGFYDLLELLPKNKERYCAPKELTNYNTINDYIPRIFVKSECPEYFQEINSLLITINMEHLLQYFVKANMPLIQFLSVQDEDLENVGIELPINRMKILVGLLDFHLNHWSKKSIACVDKLSTENFYDILMMIANHLQHLIIIQSTLQFVQNNIKQNIFGPIHVEKIEYLKKNLIQYRKTTKELKKVVTYLASFSPTKSPLYIDVEDIIALKQYKRHRFKRFIKYSAVIGISVFVCLQIKRCI